MAAIEESSESGALADATCEGSSPGEGAGGALESDAAPGTTGRWTSGM
jgi:hypothetical protein